MVSKYVDKKHGLIIGSDNVFFITHDLESPEGVEQFRDGYRAIVWAKRYQFDQINSLNVFIRTPAEQLMWKIQREEVLEKLDNKEFSIERDYYILSDYCRNWLTKNIGPIYEKWDVRTKIKSSTNSSIFFKRRKDALAFVKMIESQLAGMKYWD